MRKPGTILVLIFGFFAILSNAEPAEADDCTNLPITAMDLYIRNERSLTVASGSPLSRARRDMVAASLAAAQSGDSNKAWLVSRLLNSREAIPRLLNSQLRYTWADNQWMLDCSDVFHYGNGNLITLNMRESTIPGNRVAQFTFAYSGMRLSGTKYWLWADDYWFGYADFEYSYNDNGYVISVTKRIPTAYDWADAGSASLSYSGPYLTQIYFNCFSTTSCGVLSSIAYDYDVNNRITAILQSVPTTNGWRDHTRVLNTYDGEGLLITATCEIWKPNHWYLVYMSEFSYDAFGNRTLCVNWDWDEASFEWTFSDSDTSKYANGRKYEDVYVSHRSPGDSLSRTQYTYDANGNLTESLNQYWLPELATGRASIRGDETGHSSGVTGVWVNSTRSIYVYPVAAVSAFDDEAAVPVGFSISQNYPNPFNLSTVIDYSLDHTGLVRVSVMNILGQTVATLVDQLESEGRHRVEWNGRDNSGDDLASGIYFYSITTNRSQQTRKMTLLK